ncbi:MAG: hypothetical protein AABZ60_17010 [Planctomycetota bacterium]
MKEEWVYWIPWIFYAFRVSCVFALLAVPLKHPARDLLVVLILLLALASDLVDGCICRALKITHLVSIYWGDHGADLICAFGSLIVLGNNISFAKDPPRKKRLTPEERYAKRWQLRAKFLFWLVLGTGLVVEIYFLMLARALRMI